MCSPTAYGLPRSPRSYVSSAPRHGLLTSLCSMHEFHCATLYTRYCRHLYSLFYVFCTCMHRRVYKSSYGSGMNSISYRTIHFSVLFISQLCAVQTNYPLLHFIRLWALRSNYKNKNYTLTSTSRRLCELRPLFTVAPD